MSIEFDLLVLVSLLWLYRVSQCNLFYYTGCPMHRLWYPRHGTVIFLHMELNKFEKNQIFEISKMWSVMWTLQFLLLILHTFQALNWFKNEKSRKLKTIYNSSPKLLLMKHPVLETRYIRNVTKDFVVWLF